MRHLARTYLLVVLLVLGIFSSGLASPFDNGHWPIVITPSSSVINTGDVVGFTLGMNQSGSSPTTVYLSSDHPGLLPVPSSVTVSTGQNTAYTESSNDVVDGPPGSPVYVTITATANGHSAQTVIQVN